MDNALAQAGSTATPAAAPGALSRLATLPAAAKFKLGLGAAGLVAVLAALALWTSKGDYRVLYANLNEKDGGAIIAQLSQMNIPYRHADGGNAILVPSDKVHDARLKLASAGLPKGSVIGFELMDSARFGQTQFQERLTFQRGLEGELTRSILALGAVQSARVHLALPQHNGFFREQQKPSASVLLSLHPGRALDRAQVAGIVHLVSSSVPELTTKAVSVIDQTGALLSGGNEGASGQGLDAQQLQYVQQIEQNYVKRVVDILEPVVGRDNLRATVTAEVDFSQTESTAEEYKPNQGGAPATVRSQQLSESGSGAQSTPSGVPGAASNQPPVPATAPITGAAAPLQAAATGLAGGSARRDAVTNYEVDKTVRVTRAATGSVKRLNAAVVVNHRVTTAPNGKTTSTPLTGEELDKLTTLVQEALGYSKERGDSVKLINAPFKVEALPKQAELPFWKQDGVVDLLRGAATPAALVLVAAMVLFGLVRPALKAAQPAAATPAARAAGGQLDLVADDPLALPGAGAPMLEAPRGSERLENARAVAKQNPAAVANIVRGWVNGEVS
ncbi:MAG TPA: flagellar basal-body MS-ring/collar protein FliF [Burkholderiaceae bacterium]|nr:flagellar basal-body MS-ring/collar protein FliF [Burkholderiaceae bacterium]